MKTTLQMVGNKEVNMKHALEVIWAVSACAATWLIGHWSPFMAGITITTAALIGVLRLRREWKHRNDPPKD